MNTYFDKCTNSNNSCSTDPVTVVRNCIFMIYLTIHFVELSRMQLVLINIYRPFWLLRNNVIGIYFFLKSLTY